MDNLDHLHHLDHLQQILYLPLRFVVYDLCVKGADPTLEKNC